MPMPMPDREVMKTVAKLGTAGFVAAATFIAGWEGKRLTAVHEHIDPPGIITVCQGITNYDKPDLKVGDRFTDQQCRDMFAAALVKYDNNMMKCIHVPLSQNTRVAMLSFNYNVGQGNFCKSSVVRKINAGDLNGGCDALMLFVNANGKRIQGLANRRAAERKLCKQPDTDTGAVVFKADDFTPPKPEPAPLPKPKPAFPPSPPKPAPVSFWGWLIGARS